MTTPASHPPPHTEHVSMLSRTISMGRGEDIASFSRPRMRSKGLWDTQSDIAYFSYTRAHERTSFFFCIVWLYVGHAERSWAKCGRGTSHKSFERLLSTSSSAPPFVAARGKLLHVLCASCLPHARACVGYEQEHCGKWGGGVFVSVRGGRQSTQPSASYTRVLPHAK